MNLKGEQSHKDEDPWQENRWRPPTSLETLSMEVMIGSTDLPSMGMGCDKKHQDSGCDVVSYQLMTSCRACCLFI